ncbi:hypothetical protein [Providencia rettgeri]|uniref:hypothetical protein n=1 Tax=Providencia rettgeri TaxID=587 RepID=UPI0029405F9C|nr:hypothetical protein [Providencia rettgeri]ELR5220138.1 hypothetical protein [Providencia rettgeri]MDX7322644.1 hypothetical protein [Providencia rettgeri]
MKERGIIFNSEMVRAILDGRKTQTRRIINPQPELTQKSGFKWKGGLFGAGSDDRETNRNFAHKNCPLGKIGVRLWVRETFQAGLCTESTFAYKATHKPSDLEEGWDEIIKWRPSIHMPRFASRITLEITNVRVERLQSISEEDAKAEGFDNSQSDAANSIGWFEKPIRAFRRAWENIYGTEGWGSNPWVWVIEFKKVE